MSPEEFKNVVLHFRMIFKEIHNNTLDFEYSFKKLYDISTENKLFWRFCPFSVYKNSFVQRKDYFLSLYAANEVDFANEELSLIYDNYQNPEQADSLFYPCPDENSHILHGDTDNVEFINCETEYLILILNRSFFKTIYYDDKRKIEFLKSIIEKENDSSNLLNSNSIGANSTITWDGSKVDFITLAKAIYESGNVKAESQKYFFNQLSEFFNADIQRDGKKELENINNKYTTGGNHSKYLDDLKQSLEKWLKKIEEQNEHRNK
jgi:hypothetical protein